MAWSSPSAGPGASAHSRRELPSSSGGPTPPTVGAPPTGSQEWASAGPGASTCPHGSGVVGVDGLLVQAGVGGSVLLFGPERDPPANPACSLPLKSLRSVRMGLRSTVPTKLFPPASSPPHTDAHPFLKLHGQQVQVVNMCAQHSRELRKCETGKNTFHTGSSRSRRDFLQRSSVSRAWSTIRVSNLAPGPQDARASVARKLGRASCFQCGVYVRQVQAA